MKTFTIVLVLVLSPCLGKPEEDSGLDMQSVLKRAYGWDSFYKKSLNFECPAGESIYQIESAYSRRYKDRKFRLRCRPTLVNATDCSWSRFMNSYDQPLYFNCGDQALISGIISQYSNEFQDRITKFKCCRLIKGVLTNCHVSEYAGNYGAQFNFQVRESTRHLYGVFSAKGSTRNDRRYSFETCYLYAV